MGANSNKKEILKTLENSECDKKIFGYENPKIEYKINYVIDEKDENNLDDSFDFSFEKEKDINDTYKDIKNIKKYPYNSIGTISVQFPLSDEIFIYTCFLIDTNMVVTLASNIENTNKGGKAKFMVTSFSKESVKWENIFIQEEESNENNLNKDNKNSNEKDKDNFLTKLAVIIYDTKINEECLGVDVRANIDFDSRDTFVVFSIKE